LTYLLIDINIILHVFYIISHGFYIILPVFYITLPVFYIVFIYYDKKYLFIYYLQQIN